jgi:hypothetical protein
MQTTRLQTNAGGSFRYKIRLAQDDPQSVDDAGQTANEGGNDIDPKVVVDLAVLHVHGKRGNKERYDDLQNFVVHIKFSFGLFECTDLALR